MPMLASNVREQIAQLVDAEFRNRSQRIPEQVEARLRRLVADRGQGGHLTIEISKLLGEELRERVQNWTQIILRVVDTHKVSASKSLPNDFRAELQQYVNRDREAALAMMRQKYQWLPLEIDKINFAASNEVEKQCAEASVRLHKPNANINWPRVGKLLAGAVTLAAAVVAILKYLGIDP